MDARESESDTMHATDAAASEPRELTEAERAERERRRIENQLAQLEKKQAELRRALATATHPGLADGIREVEGRAYGVARVEERLAQPLSKSEERRREKLEKKLTAARERRAALDAEIAALEREVAALSEERIAALSAERQEALVQLFNTLAKHADAFERAGLKCTELVPELEAWLPELRTLAGDVADA